jgi:hypothetical protein
MRALARYQPQPEHEAFVEGLLLESRLRARILVSNPPVQIQEFATLEPSMLHS